MTAVKWHLNYGRLNNRVLENWQLLVYIKWDKMLLGKKKIISHRRKIKGPM